MSREEDAYVIERMGKLLAEIAIIVNGTEPHDTLWSYHDLPEKVRALKQATPAAAVEPAPVMVALPDPVMIDGTYYYDALRVAAALRKATQAPPAAAVSADTERLLFLQKFLLDLGEVEYNIEKGCMCGCCWAFSLSGGGIDVEGETLEQAIDRAMLAAANKENTNG